MYSLNIFKRIQRKCKGSSSNLFTNSYNNKGGWGAIRIRLLNSHHQCLRGDVDYTHNKYSNLPNYNKSICYIYVNTKANIHAK